MVHTEARPPLAVPKNRHSQLPSVEDTPRGILAGSRGQDLLILAASQPETLVKQLPFYWDCSPRSIGQSLVSAYSCLPMFYSQVTCKYLPADLDEAVDGASYRWGETPRGSNGRLG